VTSQETDTTTQPPVPSVRILLVDDHAVVRHGLRMLIDSDPELEVIGEARDRAGAVALAESGRPDIVLLDLDLGAESGLDLIGDLRAVAPDVRILVLTGVRDAGPQRKAIHLGAMGIVEKEAAPELLLKAIRKVRDGEVWLDRTTTASVLSEMSLATEAAKSDPEAAKIATLSAREKEVVALLGEGLSNRRIAGQLCISETTVRHHLTSIFAKLEVHDRLQLLLYAYKNKLVNLPPSV
jgi:two-component system, NarL family, nitrate/nitrite response regulator NarL